MTNHAPDPDTDDIVSDVIPDGLREHLQREAGARASSTGVYTFADPTGVVGSGEGQERVYDSRKAKGVVQMDVIKSKTFWASLAACCAAAGGFFAGEINLTEAITAGFLALTQIFQRVAITKAAK